MTFPKPLHFAGFFLSLQTFALVVLLLPPGETQFDLGFAFAEVDFQGNEGIPFFLALPEEPFDFEVVEQELSNPFRFMVVVGSMGVGADVTAMEVHFSLPDFGVAVLQVGLPLSQGFYFCSQEYQACLDLFQDFVVVVSLFVLANDPQTFVWSRFGFRQ